jgi:uncharacterized cupin superfamily protein
MSAIDRINGLTGTLGVKAPVRAATTANITLSGEQTIDGVAVVAGDRVLVKDQTSTLDNGIWDAATGAWSRSPDFDGARDVLKGTMVLVSDGSTNASTAWSVATSGPVIGSAMTFTPAVFETASSVAFLQSGTGAVLTTVQADLRTGTIKASQFGALPSASAATNDAGIAAAIAEIVSRGGGTLLLDTPGTYDVSEPIVLYSKVYLLGLGSSATKVKLAASSNCNVIETHLFSTLTLQNKWVVSDGVPYGFGIESLTVDGNRTNQTSGNGVAFYGKGYHVGFDVKVVDAKEVGFYSEAGDVGGQFAPEDMPEGNIGKLQIYMSGKEGFLYRGPHDQPIHDVSVSQAGQDGVYDGVAFERVAGSYFGTTYITGSIHSYACTGRGISLRCNVLANMLTGENNDRDGVVFEAPAETTGNPGGGGSQVNWLEAYGNDNDDTGLYWGVRISGTACRIGNVRISSAGQAAGGLYVNSNYTSIGGGSAIGANATADGVGLKVDGSYNQVNLNVNNFDSGSAVGFESAGTAHSTYNVTLFNCSATGWLNSGASVSNHFTVSGFAASGTPFTQSSTFSTTDTFNVKFNYTAGGLGYSDWGSTSAIVLGETSQTVTHNGFTTPTASQIHLTQMEDWGANRMWIDNITATTFDVVTDSAVAAALSFAWRMEI